MAEAVRPAATVILVRDAPDGLHTLLLRRNSALGFAAGVWVFPGGRVDDSEAAAAADALDAARLAAVRETREEARLLLEPRSLVHYSHWTTPPIMPKRYATWFFIARAPVEDAVTVDGDEIHDHLWVRPQEALERHRKDEIELLPPTYVTLFELAQCASVDEVIERTGRRTPPVFVPRFVVREGEHTVSIYEGDAGYEDADPDAAGPRHRMVLAPGNWHYLNDGAVTW